MVGPTTRTRLPVPRSALELITLIQGIGLIGFVAAAALLHDHAVAVVRLGDAILTSGGMLGLLLRLRNPRMFVPWLLCVLAVLAGTFSGMVGTQSHPAVAFVAEALYVVFGVGSVMGQLSHRMSRRRGTVVFDVLALTGVITAIVTNLLPLATATTDLSTQAALARLCYSMGDVVVMGSLVSVQIMLRRVPDLQLVLVTVATGGVCVGDLVSTLSSSDFAVHGVVSQAVETVCMFILCLGACIDGPDPQSRVIDRYDRAEVAVPVVTGAAALLLLSPLMSHPLPTASRWAALCALALVGVRIVHTGRELGELMVQHRQVRVDQLTGLANRVGMTAWLADTVEAARAADPGGTVALLVMDVDQFKEVNDSLGHDRGDAVIYALGRRLEAGVTRPTTRVARMGGDEFAVLITEDAHIHSATEAAQQVVDMMHEPIEIDGTRLQLNVSIGVVVADPAVTAASDMLRWADIAMYRAKTSGSGIILYDPEFTDPAGEDRLRLLGELRQVLSGGHDGRFGALEVFYQPKVELRTGRVTGAEALVRWSHPERGLLFPDTFLPLAGEAGLMPRVTDIVLASSLDQAALWQAEGRGLSVAVNLPPAAVVDADLPDRVAAALADRRLPADALVLEITEESLLSDRVRARVVLARLRSMGVAVSIDDYGTGYSSLAYLRELPVDELKLDRSFVTPMACDERAAAIVRSTVDLAHSLGLRIVAEGVEHGGAADQLGGYGCDHAQGYHYARPLPIAEFEVWLREQDAAHAALPDQRTVTPAG